MDILSIMRDTTHTQWVGVKDTAEHIGVSRATLYRYLAAGLPSHQITGANGRRFFDLAEVDAWLRSRCTDREAAA